MTILNESMYMSVNFPIIIIYFQGTEPDSNKMKCVDCSSGKYKDNDANHKTCQLCNKPGKIVTSRRTKCELCPSVSFLIPIQSYQAAPNTSYYTHLVYNHLVNI